MIKVAVVGSGYWSSVKPSRYVGEYQGGREDHTFASGQLLRCLQPARKLTLFNGSATMAVWLQALLSVSGIQLASLWTLAV
jgi:hypothetical protein